MNTLSCIGSLGFFTASMFTMFAGNELKNRYINKLTYDQYLYYILVKKERFKVWTIATFIALIVAGCVYGLVEAKTSTEKACIMTFAFFLVQYFVYILYPKKYWMLNKSTTQPDVQNWLNMYKHMKYNYHIGFVLGLIGFFLGSYTLNNV